jgi:hypothetical protein
MVKVVGKIKSEAGPVTGCGAPQGCETSRFPHFLMNGFTDGGEVVSFTRRPPFTPRDRFLVLISVRGSVDLRAIVRLEGLGPTEKPMPLSGMHPSAFQLVAN